MLGFFSFTEVTDPSAHRDYNEWHQLDHLPEQFTLDGVLFGQRWVCSPRCQELRVAASPLLARCHYMTLYLMRDADVLPGFFDLAVQLRDADRFFAERQAHLSGPFEVRDRWVAARIPISAAALPHRPWRGIYVVVGPLVDGAALVEVNGVGGAWAFMEATAPRHITVAFVDGDLEVTAAALGRWCRQAGEPMEWAGPLEGIDAFRWDWFDRLTAQ